MTSSHSSKGPLRPLSQGDGLLVQGGCLFIIGRCTQRPYNLKRIEREFSVDKVGFPFSVFSFPFV